MRIPCFFFCS